MYFNTISKSLNPATRYLLVVLAAILALTSTRVQVAEAQVVSQDTAVPTSSVPSIVLSHAEEPVAVTQPVRKKWQKVNGPDLETRADHSVEPALRTMVVATTAYTSDPHETDATPFTTANGTQIYDGVVAANFLKFGTRVRIPEYFGDKVFVVHDRMNPRFPHRLDIWMTKKAGAYAWGVRRVKLEILP